MAGNVYQVNVVLPGGSSVASAGTIAVGTCNVYAFTAPSAADGGGVSIVHAYAYSESGDGAGSALTVKLTRYSSAGAVEGTICSAIRAAGSLWAAGSIYPATISDAFVDANEHVFVNVIGTAASATVSDRRVSIAYQMGK